MIKSIMIQDQKHTSVLLNEAVSYLLTQIHDASYIDATFGRGGHSREILANIDSSSILYALDRDDEAVSVGRELENIHSNFHIHKIPFSKINTLNVIKPLMGVLFDLGVSSPQLDDGARGFSFQKDARLDMRMDQSQPYSAYEFVNTAPKELLEKALFELGEEKFARKIVKSIIENRPITTTLELSSIIAKLLPKGEKIHPATRTFQAIRMYINQELEEIKESLEAAYEMLNIGGRMCVITFHSLEDRAFKDFVKEKTIGSLPTNIPIAFTPKLKIIAKKILPSPEEIARNPRSRSAKLRVVEKLC